MKFLNREHAGRYLVRSLGEYADRADTIVLALPRGGVAVAHEVAKALELPLDVIVVRKLGVPGQEEAAMGAIATGGVRVLSCDILRILGITHEQIEEVTAREQFELKRREREYRGDRPPLRIHGQTVLLVDDGLATGSTMRAAIEAAMQLGAAQVVVAAPVGSADACRELAKLADRVVCPLQPRNFRAISCWYEEFPQTGDQEVHTLLADISQRKHSAQA